jgi:hypothetical protein
MFLLFLWQFCAGQNILFVVSSNCLQPAWLFLSVIHFVVFGCFRWSFDETVTHFIYQGRPNDTNREYRSVKERGIHIVSEHWLLEVSSAFSPSFSINWKYIQTFQNTNQCQWMQISLIILVNCVWWRTMARVCRRAELLTCPGRERKRGRDWGPTVPFEGTPPKTSPWANWGPCLYHIGPLGDSQDPHHSTMYISSLWHWKLKI